MRHVLHLIQICAHTSADSAGFGSRPQSSQRLAGYVLKLSCRKPHSNVSYRSYTVMVTSAFGESEGMQTIHDRQPVTGRNTKRLSLHPIGRLVPVENSQATQQGADISRLQSVPSGQAYIVTSPPAHGLVTATLAKALKSVFEQFASDHGFSREKPLEIYLSQGYKEGRAVDIAAVGGKSLLQWKQMWDRDLDSAQKLIDPQQKAEAIDAEPRRNLGYGLYKALQTYGGWRVYRNVTQLFGPWIASEGPWKAMKIENPTAEEHQRVAEQQRVFQAYRNHIHVAK
jgi:hypothetical protein